MKWLTISIFSLVLIPWTTRQANCQDISVSAGIYDFTDITTREFYVLAPTISVGMNVWKPSRLGINVSTGLSFTSVRYNSHRHYFYMVPVNVTINYDLANPGAKVWPSIGMGLSLAGKADVNSDLGKTHYALTYGYIATGGLRYRPGNTVSFSFDLAYNLLMPPTMEELNLSGVTVLVGARFPLWQAEKEK